MLKDLYHRLRLDRRDFQIIVGLFLIDITLTIYGISSGAGSELSPFFRPFTGTVALMVAGSLIYIGILSVLSYVLKGTLRTVLAAGAIGMHFDGILSWLHLFTGLDIGSSIIYIHYMIIAGSTATAYALLDAKGWTY